MRYTVIKIHDEMLNRDWYLYWSTVVDAPISFGMSIDELREYVQRREGEDDIRELPDRLARVDRNGSSCLEARSVAEVILANRAGPEESEATIEQILDWYCRSWWKCGLCGAENCGFDEKCWQQQWHDQGETMQMDKHSLGMIILDEIIGCCDDHKVDLTKDEIASTLAARQWCSCEKTFDGRPCKSFCDRGSAALYFLKDGRFATAVEWSDTTYHGCSAARFATRDEALRLGLDEEQARMLGLAEEREAALSMVEDRR